MRIDPSDTRAMASTLADTHERTAAGRRPWLRLLTALLDLAGGKAELLRHAERPWASVTFSGSRHTIALVFNGADAIASGEAFVVALPDHEFTIARQLVADAAIVAVDHTLVPEPAMTVEAEILLLDD